MLDGEQGSCLEPDKLTNVCLWAVQQNKIDIMKDIKDTGR